MLVRRTVADAKLEGEAGGESGVWQQTRVTATVADRSACRRVAGYVVDERTVDDVIAGVVHETHGACRAAVGILVACVKVR